MFAGPLVTNETGAPICFDMCTTWALGVEKFRALLQDEPGCTASSHDAAEPVTAHTNASDGAAAELRYGNFPG